MPDQSEMEVLAAARDWKAAGRGVALATVVKTWGSSPRPAGSHLVVCDDGSFLGSVSGGCVEGAVLAAARDWKAAGRGVALATVVKTWGSSPRPPGSHLVVCDDGSFLGSVSGGCVEGAVVEEALGVMKAGLSKVLEFGVTHEQAWEVGLACGGTVRIFVEPVQ